MVTQPGPVSRTRLMLGVALTACLVELWLAHRTALPGGILDRRATLFLEVCGWWVAYGVALWAVLRLPRRTALLLVVGVAVLLRLASLSDKAPLSDDLYRYAWDGLVQTQGIDPYRYPPQAEQLRALRDPWLWPPELAEQERVTLLNRPNVRTIYPPVAEAWFAVEHLAVPLSLRDKGYEGVGLLLDLAVLAALLALLRARGKDLRWAAAWALSPLAVLESVQNAHVDTLAVLLVLGGFAAALHRRTLAASTLITAAALVKIYPGLLLLPLLRERGRRVQIVALAAGLSVLAYLPHVLAVGWQVIGYLPGYLHEEQYGAGTRYLLVGLTGLHGTAATALVVTALVLLVAWVLRRDLPLPEAGLRVLTGVFLLVTPVQPWYGLLLLACVVLCGAWEVLPLAFAAYPLLFATILDGPALLAGRLSFALAAAVLLVHYLLVNDPLVSSRRRGSGSGGGVRRSHRRAAPAVPERHAPA